MYVHFLRARLLEECVCGGARVRQEANMGALSSLSDDGITLSPICFLY